MQYTLYTYCLLPRIEIVNLVFPRVSMFREIKSRDTFRFKGKQNYFAIPGEQALYKCFYYIPIVKVPFSSVLLVESISCESDEISRNSVRGRQYVIDWQITKKNHMRHHMKLRPLDMPSN
jgi:hypothetical protein